nr:immunoglobulin heavy chain junction region [Mus musculus]
CARRGTRYFDVW